MAVSRFRRDQERDPARAAGLLVAATVVMPRPTGHAYPRRMNAVKNAVAALRGCDRSEWLHYLNDHSGLPGPRANLTLVDAVIEVADRSFADELMANGGEYPAMCAAAFFGSQADDVVVQARAHALASDSRWRVREGLARGLQSLGDRALTPFLTVTEQWSVDPDVLVQRAAIAALCEPRLLRTAEVRAAALAACDSATTQLAALPKERRSVPEARTLRQALGYCWSVAVAADPVLGLPMFRELDTTNPDVAWIVAQNTHKQRLAKLL